MAVTVADVFSIMTGGYFNSTEATVITGAPPPSTGGRFERLLNRVATVTNTSSAYDSTGADITPTVTVTENVKCRLNEEVNTYIQDGKVLNVKEYIAFFLPTADIALRDVVTIESKDYTVTDVDPIYQRRKLHHYEITLERMGALV